LNGVLAVRPHATINCETNAKGQLFHANYANPGDYCRAAGHRIIDKEHRGIRIFLRLGPLSQEDAEHPIDAEEARVESDLLQKANARPRFADAAARYLEESRDHRTVDVTKWHIRLLIPHIGTLELNRIHDRRSRASSPIDVRQA
jgi:hypothetical protein